MKQNKFADEHIVGILQEAEKGERTIDALCGEKEITQTTFYRWWNRFGGVSVKEAQRVPGDRRGNARQISRIAPKTIVDCQAVVHRTPDQRAHSSGACVKRSFIDFPLPPLLFQALDQPL